MLDRDIAALYGVGSKQINQAVKRNPEKFTEPEYCFVVTENERSQIVTFQQFQGIKFTHKPRLFTKKGCHMLGTVLNTPQAIAHTKVVIDTFDAVESGQLPMLAETNRRIGLLEQKIVDLPEQLMKKFETKLDEKIKQNTDAIGEAKNALFEKIIGLTPKGKKHLWDLVAPAINSITDEIERSSVRGDVVYILTSYAGGRYDRLTSDKKKELFVLAEKLAKLIMAQSCKAQAAFFFNEPKPRQKKVKK